MAEFVKRTQAPTESDRWYFADNPFYKSGYGLPNCTCYAWGRFYELSGVYPNLSLNNAEFWYGHADGYLRGQTPRLGAIICWRKGEVSHDDGPGHVAIVEEVYPDGSILTSNSAYGGSYFYTQVLEAGYYMGDAYTFQGFIYNPVSFDGGEVTVTPISGNRYLTQSEMEVNAQYIWQYLGSRGWSLNAVAGMLGNMETESTINPGIWESLTENVNNGYGLVQWTPATKYLDWCEERNLEPDELSTALERIIYELENGLQFYPTNTYRMTFQEFKTSTEGPYTLGMVFLYNYERPATLNQPNRGTQAERWYTYLSALPPPGRPVKRKGLPLWMMFLASRRRV